MIPYGKQSISEEDIQAIVEVLRSERLTQGPVIEQFERAIANYCGSRYAVAVANGTAALHLASLAAGFEPGKEVITTPITFVASANCILYVKANPIFADIDPQTYCIDPMQIRARLSSSTRGLIPVHFGGQPCDMEKIHAIAKEKNLIVIEDAAHALGATYTANSKTFKVGSCAHSDMTIFSFHPVKHITTGEGGMVTTNNEDLYKKLLSLRTHGITREPDKLRHNDGPWYYEQQALGYNYRITDIQCALGFSQLQRLDKFIARRREIAGLYNEAFAPYAELITPLQRKGTQSSWHIYVLGFKTLDRKNIFKVLSKKGLGVNVHYIPVHLQPFYTDNFNYKKGDYPSAEAFYKHSLTLPLYPGMSDNDVNYVITAVLDATVESHGC